MSLLSLFGGLAEELFWWVPFGNVPEVLPAELMKRIETPGPSPQLLDVRPPQEWCSGHIAGSVNVPLTELRSMIHRLSFDLQKPVVAICRTAHQSIPAVRLLTRHGFNEAAQLSGGMNAWRTLGLPESKKTNS